MRAVIFDYGHVLSTAPAESQTEIETLAGGGGDTFWAAYWALREAYDRDELDSPAYWREVGDRIGASFSAGQVARLVEADHRRWSVTNEPLLTWAHQLKAAGIRVGLLSNAPRDFAEYVRQAMAWSSEFDWLTFSGEVGTAKPDPAIYHHCLEGLGLRDPGSALFIDDREVNVEAARALGMAAHQFTTVESLAADLAGMDGLPPLRAGR